MRIPVNHRRGWKTPGKRWKNFIGKTQRCRGRTWISTMRKVFHKWTSKRFCFYPYHPELIKDIECIIVRQKVFGMKLKGWELVLGTELPEG